MLSNIQKLITIATSFAYSWIPALLILWFLSARKYNTKLILVLSGFLLGAALSIIAGFGNKYVSIHWFPGDENPAFFMSVGIIEELIKFTASFGSLLVISRSNWKKDLQTNWLAQALSGSLGFAAAENFVYGIDGQGGIARVVPLIAHIFFAVFWGIGFYRFSLHKKIGNGVFWLILGLLEGIVLHGVYDCAVSENIIPAPLKVIVWILMGLLIISIFYWHLIMVRKLEDASKINESKQLPSSELLEKNQKPNFTWSLLSFFIPGFGHFAGRKEYLTGLSFFVLSILLPCLLIRLSVNELANNLNESMSSEQQIIQGLLIVLAFSFLCYFAIGLWSAWELQQNNVDVNSSDTKKRLTALFPVSTLFFVSLMMSFLLPAFEKKQKGNAEGKKVVIKEIPLGITWEVEKVPPAPQKNKSKEVENQDENNSITLEQNPKEEATKFSKDEDKNSSKDKPPSGVANSDSLNRNNLPAKLPKIGYIGVQLSELEFKNEIRSYIAFVYPGTSAARAGLRTGDFILSVDGRSTQGLDAFEVSRLVRGPLGSSVEIIVYREGEGKVTIKAYRTGTLFSDQEDNQLLNPTFKQLREI
ncbi:MAG: PDZ domain-containing protein [Candidatus Caenarcaniphilales bacterium]|nr:PDZ domain-containing protein [Candidatus Caenarcaniphilales bacterium]